VPTEDCVEETADGSIHRLVGFDDKRLAKHVKLGSGDTVEGPYVLNVNAKDLAGQLVTLAFHNCCTGKTVVSFDIRIEMYNIMSNGEKSYLSLGEIELPSVYFVRSPLTTNYQEVRAAVH
jgi:hypothetical protein